MTERFFIRSTPEVRKALLHLAIDLEASVEKLAGRLLAQAIERAESDVKAGKIKLADIKK